MLRVDASYVPCRKMLRKGAVKPIASADAAMREGRLLVVNSHLDRAPDRGRPPFTVTALTPPAAATG